MLSHLRLFSENHDVIPRGAADQGLRSGDGPFGQFVSFLDTHTSSLPLYMIYKIQTEIYVTG